MNNIIDLNDKYLKDPQNQADMKLAYILVDLKSLVDDLRYKDVSLNADDLKEFSEEIADLFNEVKKKGKKND